MKCQCCGADAPTKHVRMYENIGLLVVRLSRTAEGDYCKSCIQSTFWKFTGVNLLFGWWGIISMVLNPFLILNNIVQFAGSFSLAGSKPGVRPELTLEAIDRMNRYSDEMFARLQSGIPMEQVAMEYAEVAKLTPGQVRLYIRAAQATEKPGQMQPV